MAKVLRESPGLLILDEGHNPRSTKSRLRKVLMKVETDQRILLSGTLFQNNFCEYFNTLSLARPMFIKEVLKTLDPKFKRKKKGAQKARHLLESRARKFFLDNIASKINSDEAEEKMQGLNMLRNMTNGFIDVYEGTASDTLPGLQIYTILMNPTDIQHQILVKLHKIMEKCPGYPPGKRVQGDVCVESCVSCSQEREGELELFERGRVMDKFEELGGSSRVLLASITACAEGISLTAASRAQLKRTSIVGLHGRNGSHA
ncbi:hypothetical protein OIU76_021848 [Salix suchowensis]|nr:hypothetical protein OIU76_021848 [Salix suchowensis]